MKKLFFIIVMTVFPMIVAAQHLYLYGGRDHKVKLGCLTCSEYSSESIWNEYSKYGNEYNSNSIWNEYGTYGSEYSSYSPWNEYATYPPVVVDKDGNFYGYFTVNEYKSDRAEFELALYIYEYYEDIRKDVTRWYKRIFE